MPHLVIEHSANIEDLLDVDELVAVAHQALVAAGPLPLGGIRTRAARRDRYRIADGHPDNGFIHMTLTIGSGRDEATRSAVGAQLFEAVAAYVKPVMEDHPLALSCYLLEAHPAASWKAGSLHEAVAGRRQGEPSE